MSCKWIAPALVAAGLLVAFGTAQADEKKMDDKKMMEHGGMDEAMMKKMMELSTPGEAHKRFDAYVGDWKASIKMYMMGPEPTVSTGTVHFEKVLDGRYLMGIHKGDFNGMPFEGHSLDGYDNAKKEYFSLWIDNMGTGYMAMTGGAAADGKSVTYKGRSFDPMYGKEVDFREVVKWTSPTAYTFEMYSSPEGKEMKMMEISYTK